MSDEESSRKAGAITYAEVQQMLDRTIGGAEVDIRAHHAFWRTLTRDQFIIKVIFEKLVVSPGDANGSNLIKALRGEAPFGSDIGTPGATMRRMPARMNPMAAEDIARIARWIDEGCPE
jgi:hypothetical protein